MCIAAIDAEAKKSPCGSRWALTVRVDTKAGAQSRRLFGAGEGGACAGDDAGRVFGPGVDFGAI
jgi:hypothetical protein